jgi:hypothetical protein
VPRRKWSYAEATVIGSRTDVAGRETARLFGVGEATWRRWRCSAATAALRVTAAVRIAIVDRALPTGLPTLAALMERKRGATPFAPVGVGGGLGGEATLFRHESWS